MLHVVWGLLVVAAVAYLIGWGCAWLVYRGHGIRAVEDDWRRDL